MFTLFINLFIQRKLNKGVRYADLQSIFEGTCRSQRIFNIFEVFYN